MITIKRNKLLALILFTTFFFCLPAFSDVLSDQTLANDLNYYRKVSKQKNLNANDRTFILNRIEEKYDGSGIDTTPIQQELDKTGKDGASEDSPLPEKKPIAVKKKNNTKAKGAKGKVEKIFISETRDSSKIFIAAEGVSRSNYFLMKDPADGKPSKIVLDLYDVQNKLSAAASNISPREGLFSNVSSSQFEGPPNNVVRVIAELRIDASYTVKREKNLWIITVNKTEQDNKPDKTVQAAVATPPAGDPAVKVIAGGPPVSVPVEIKFDLRDTANTSQPEKTNKSVADDYKIENSDILGVTIYPADELSREVVVQPDGNIPFPLIGAIQAKGLTIKQLENNLSSELGRYISSPQVSITVKQFSRRQIFITGEVKGVGAYSYKENLRLMEFISSIGGFTDAANRKEVKIYRGLSTKRQVHLVDVEDLIKSGDFTKDFLLEPGDIIEVQKGQPRIAILGEIKVPGYYDYKENMHLVDLVSSAGGFTDNAKITDVSIIHPSPDNKMTVVKVNLKKILSGKDRDVAVLSGDTVFFPKGTVASGSLFITNIMPWITLLTLVFAVRGGI